ncbi:hypothetical protein GCM10010911_26810 [Paenibacillus nasutitermitis]|uniref:Uncharacterized protein n=1 Tax=Paenibacillus nasutitermitis TaxID=1652958 RepID=A0A916YYA4_9BACL|nr:hypothetical protein GCM10010911_26810 [Paenibacillus nasutitermitis]
MILWSVSNKRDLHAALAIKEAGADTKSGQLLLITRIRLRRFVSGSFDGGNVAKSG